MDPALPPPFLHTVSDQKLDGGKSWVTSRAKCLLVYSSSLWKTSLWAEKVKYMYTVGNYGENYVSTFMEIRSRWKKQVFMRCKIVHYARHISVNTKPVIKVAKRCELLSHAWNLIRYPGLVRTVESSIWKVLLKLISWPLCMHTGQSKTTKWGYASAHTCTQTCKHLIIWLTRLCGLL